MEAGSEITGRLIRAALEVHRNLGPGLLESAYRACLVHELQESGLRFDVEVPLRIRYRGVQLHCGYRIDLVVEKQLLVELKAVQCLEPLHTAQMLTYLKLSRQRLGLLVNFNTVLLKNGIRRVVRSD